MESAEAERRGVDNVSVALQGQSELGIKQDQQHSRQRPTRELTFEIYWHCPDKSAVDHVPRASDKECVP